VKGLLMYRGVHIINNGKSLKRDFLSRLKT
jgi:hypothetical protein